MNSANHSIDVSVIMPVHNGMPYLREAVESVRDQDLDASQYEIIVVDDGSTDDGVSFLRRWAADGVNRVFVELGHSGSPAAPRNAGMDRARGRYIFFLDADDLLSPYALREMLATADENDADIVLPKQRALGGRSVPLQAFRSTLLKTDLFEADVYRILGPVKLFRTAFICENGLRFPEGLSRKSDVPFGVETYLHARSIAVLADKDYLSVRLREDGGNLTVTRTALGDHMPIVEFVFKTLPRHIEAGEHRDQLMVRHFRTELAKAVLEGFPPETDEAYRRRCYERFVDIAREYCNEQVLNALPVRERIIVYLLREDRYEDLCSVAAVLAVQKYAEAAVTPEGLFIAHEGFRDPDLSLPDEVFSVGPRSCVQASLIEAGEGEGMLSLRIVVRILVTNAPLTSWQVVLTRAEERVEVMTDIVVTEHTGTDVRQLEFSVPADRLAHALKSCSAGRRMLRVRVALGEVTLEVPINFMESAKVHVDRYQANRPRLGPMPSGLGWGRTCHVERTEHGRLAVRTVIRSAVWRAIWRLRRTGLGVSARRAKPGGRDPRGLLQSGGDA